MIADVWLGDRPVATLDQDLTKSVFRYRDDFDGGRWPGGGIALTLPRDAPPVETPGQFLPPFFANLLPEGFRLDAIRSRRGLAKDDGFGLLLAVGSDCIGDVRVVAEGDRPTETAPLVEGDRTEEVDFGEILDRDLESASGLPGVQEKLSDRMVSFPVRSGPRRAILKLDPPAYPLLTANEAFFMAAARDSNLRTAECRLVRDRAGRAGLLVRRFDRAESGPLPQEDGCQMTGAYPGAKYSLSVRDIADALRNYGAGTDEIARWLEMLAFGYLIGNGDLHAKNVSVTLTVDGSLVLTPIYDMLSTLPYKGLDPRMAMKMDGRDAKWKGARFREFFVRQGLPAKATDRRIERILARMPRWIDQLGEIGYDAETTDRLRAEILRRAEDLKA